MTATAQPDWELLANLGDVNPLEYGGFFVYRDRTGVYDPEVEVLVEPAEGSDSEEWTVYRVPLEPCTYSGFGVLSDNRSHPEVEAWFARDLGAVAQFSGCEESELRRGLCSREPVERALAYRSLGDYWGWHEFDHDPLVLRRDEAERRYARPTPLTATIPCAS